MQKLGYTYNGRPIMESGPRLYGSRKPPRRSLFPYFLWTVGILLILGGIYLCVSHFFFDREKKQTVSQTVPEESLKQTAQPPEMPAAAPAEQDMPVSTLPEMADMPSAGELTQEKNRQIFRVYSVAVKAFQAGRLEETRKALRMFFESLATPVSHPLYPKACDMLSTVSLRLLREGKEPADWIDYQVQRGDNLSRIAKKYNVTVSAIKETSGLSGYTLQPGQKLRIPLSSWSLRIDRKNSRLFLDKNGRLFKIYPLHVGKAAVNLSAGLYHIQDKIQDPVWQDRGVEYAAGTQENPLGSRWISLTAPGGGTQGIHGRSASTEKSNTWFSMAENDIHELFVFVPSGTPVEILEK